MKSKIAAGVLTGVIALTLVGCGINNSTVLDAAKTFTQAQIDGDSKVIQAIDHSSPLEFPAQFVLSNASKAGYSNHKIGEFKFEQVNDTTVNVFGPKDIASGSLSLSFIKEDGKFYFDNIGVERAPKPVPFKIDAKELLKDIQNNAVAPDGGLAMNNMVTTAITLGKNKSPWVWIEISNDNIQEFRIEKIDTDITAEMTKVTAYLDVKYHAPQTMMTIEADYQSKGTFVVQYKWAKDANGKYAWNYSKVELNSKLSGTKI
ncbi:MAG TPA: hypothetical protein VIM51_05400 [Desulfosporosinus sp.]